MEGFDDDFAPLQSGAPAAAAAAAGDSDSTATAAPTPAATANEGEPPKREADYSALRGKEEKK